MQEEGEPKVGLGTNLFSDEEEHLSRFSRVLDPKETVLPQKYA